MGKYEAVRRAPKLDHRLLFAIRPPGDVADRVNEIQHCLGPLGRYVRTDMLHITIGLFDDLPFLPPRLAEAAGDAVAALDSGPVRLMFDRLVSSEKSACLVASEVSPPLKAFQATLGAALGRADLPMARGWAFHPHMTLAYGAQAGLNEAILPISWEATEFVLIYSLLGQTRHIVLGRWPLIDQPRLF